MRWNLLALPLLCFVATGAADGAERTTVARTIQVDGVTRTYFLRVPRNAGPGPAPLVLVFHGGGGNGPGTERLTRFSALADREGFLVAYPEGIDRNWYDGREFAGSRAHREHIDDVGFVAALLDAIPHIHAVDPHRVYATGISNGAIFYLAARLSSRIAAIAPVVGGIADPPEPWFHPEQPVSVLVIQGTSDPLVPYHGGPIAFGRGKIIDTDEAVRRWAAVDGAAREPVEKALPAGNPKDHCGGARTSSAGGRDGSEVAVVRLQGGGHTWPGGTQYLPAMLVGRVCRDFDATALIWEFFRAHPRPDRP